MTACKYQRIYKKKLCRSDLRHKLQILRRNLLPATLDSGESVESFEVVYDKVWAAVETKNTISAFDDVNTEDRISHYFYILYSPIYSIERNNNFIFP